MEPSGRNRWQEFCYIEDAKPAYLEQFYCHWLPPDADGTGKAGFDGSSPLEGFTNSLAGNRLLFTADETTVRGVDVTERPRAARRPSFGPRDPCS
jgi:hypothetical protein